MLQEYNMKHSLKYSIWYIIFIVALVQDKGDRDQGIISNFSRRPSTIRIHSLVQTKEHEIREKYKGQPCYWLQNAGDQL